MQYAVLLQLFQDRCRIDTNQPSNSDTTIRDDDLLTGSHFFDPTLQIGPKRCNADLHRILSCTDTSPDSVQNVMAVGKPTFLADAPPLDISTTVDYTVVMPVVSIRFSDEPLHQRLKGSAYRHKIGVSTLAERLIDEGLRMEAHPMVIFRDGPAGRRPQLVGGPEVSDVIGAIVAGDVPPDQRRSRAAELLGLSEPLVDAALAYYADFSDEVDAELQLRRDLASTTEAAWRRQQELLGS